MIKRTIIFKAITLSLLTILSGCFNNFTYVAGGEDKKGFVDGFAKDAKLKNPSIMKADQENGDLYVLDQDSKVIRKISLSGQITTFFDSTKYKDLNITEIKDIDVYKNYVYFSFDRTIYKIEKTSKEKKPEVLVSFPYGHSYGRIEESKIASITEFEIKDENSIYFVNEYRAVAYAPYSELAFLDLKINNLENIKLELNGTAISLRGNKFENLKYNNEKIVFNSVIYNSTTKTFVLDTINYKLYEYQKVLFGFTLDTNSNLYFVNRNQELIKIENKTNKETILSKTWNVTVREEHGVFWIPFAIIEDHFIIYSINYLELDLKRKTLYISVLDKNHIFKIDLNKEIK